MLQHEHMFLVSFTQVHTQHVSIIVTKRFNLLHVHTSICTYSYNNVHLTCCNHGDGTAGLSHLCFLLQFYRPLNVRVALTGLEIWSDRDKIRVEKSPTDTLNNFLAWRTRELLPRLRHDNAQLVMYDIPS